MVVMVGLIWKRRHTRRIIITAKMIPETHEENQRKRLIRTAKRLLEN